jgi:Oxidoreductase family, NAD-binding Rossmann fold/Oxidoreductase family, C-terminal alpha/beta domain
MKTPSSRRHFLKLAAAGSLGAISFPTIIPSSALGKDGAVSPSERIVMGWIGTGGQGRGLMGNFLNQKDVQVVAACDVDAAHLTTALGMVNKKYDNKDCVAFRDFRQLLARKDIDAVCIATPDHWHALACVAAAHAGKDIYCEKPLANSIGEGRAIVEAVKRNKRVLQTGSMERSGDNARFACEVVRNGKLGKLDTVRINLPCTDAHHKQIRAASAMPPAQQVPEGFDYDFWLGHTPKVPYYQERCHFKWRFILAYGGGEMTDRGAPVIDLGKLGAGIDETGPVEIEATGVQNKSGLYDAFWDYTFTNTYKNGLKVVGSTAEPRGVKFEGSDGWIFIHVHGAKLEASDPALLNDLAEWKKTDGNIHKIKLGRSGGSGDVPTHLRHYRNFLESVVSRKQPVASAEIGHRTASLCHLNNIAMRLGRKLEWDPGREKFNDEEANNWILPKMRAPWTLAALQA